MKALLFSSGLLACVALGLAQEFFFLATACAANETCGGSGSCEAGSSKCSCRELSTAHGQKCVSRQYILGNGETGKCSEEECNKNGSTCSEMSDKPTCICPPGTVLSKQEKCTPVSFNTSECTGFDDNLYMCSARGGVCTSNRTCLCHEHLYAVNEKCVPIKFDYNLRLGGCIPDTKSCGGTMGLGMCLPDERTCLCEYPSYAGERGESRGDFYCFLYAFKLPSSDHCYVNKSAGNNDETSGTCSFGNGRCEIGSLPYCTCKPGYVALGGMCVNRAIQLENVDDCVAGERCAGENSFCQYLGLCKCVGEYFLVDGRCVKSYYDTEECPSTGSANNKKTCSQNLGKCHEGVCHCVNESWFDEELNRCVSGTFPDPNCDEIGQKCKSIVDGTCLRARTCKCDHGYFTDTKKACVLPRTDDFLKVEYTNLACVSACLDVWVAVVSIVVATLVS